MKPRLFHSSPIELARIEPREQYTNQGELGHFVFAQPNDVLAHAYALKNKATFIAGFTKGSATEWVSIVTTPERNCDWETSLHKTENGVGGFIYEVDPKTFDPRHGEWVSTQAATIISSPRFVTMEDVMKKGVQIFIVTDVTNYSSHSPIWKEGNPNPVLMEGYKNGGIRWLNQERDMNAIMPPTSRNAPIVEPAFKALSQ